MILWKKEYNNNYIHYVNLVKYIILTIFSIKKSLKKDRKYFYYETIVSYNFKLDLIFYNVLENTNKKILLKVYKNQIFELVVKPWLLKCQNFVLKKDSNNGYKKTYNWNII